LTIKSVFKPVYMLISSVNHYKNASPISGIQRNLIHFFLGVALKVWIQKFNERNLSLYSLDQLLRVKFKNLKTPTIYRGEFFFIILIKIVNFSKFYDFFTLFFLCYSNSWVRNFESDLSPLPIEFSFNLKY
jgi:hypothetical protein